ncbi:DUF6768 family protein [Tautonia marina]|uniref:DUF6768 family protein n=1 Tax=Tautonia marina TaxID=2653855 RepID=UPI001261114F|nr:DUF6768 family protein [Tautonia marina]
MKTQDHELDTLIRAALSAEERTMFDRLGEPSLPELMTESFRGRRRWINVYATVVTFAFFGLAVVSAVKIFQTDEVVDILRWGLGFGLGLAVSLALKVWFWLDMQRHSLSREIKRIELAVAHLAHELNSHKGPSS